MLSNKETYKQLKAQFGITLMPQFCIMVSEMYNIHYQNSTKDVINEASYERDWWMEKYNRLTKYDGV